jgi:hypothetical protein
VSPELLPGRVAVLLPGPVAVRPPKRAAAGWGVRPAPERELLLAREVRVPRVQEQRQVRKRQM